MWIYVSGPYTGGNRGANVSRAIRAGLRLREMGHVPIIPHLFHLAHLIDPQPYDFWMSWDLELLRRCDAILRFSGESPGADKEVEAAERAGLKVYYSIDEVPKAL